MEKVIDVTTARQQLGSLLDEVYFKHETIVIERKGKALARLMPMEDSNEHVPSKKRQQLLKTLNSLPIIAMDQDPTDVLRTLRAEKAKRVKEIYGG